MIAKSFERIHRSNLIGVGILPLVFCEGQSLTSRGLTGEEVFSLDGLSDTTQSQAPLRATVLRPNGETVIFNLDLDVRSQAEADLLKRGGMFEAAFKNSLESFVLSTETPIETES